ncbi:MAG: hypoxanthine phosphoribosyltransferase [Planctomycetia bacterium]|nr:hypoxanthine phosphoribosyltransferase [Planctomycetia bacterium]
MKILLTQDEVREGVTRMARDINACYGKRPVTIVGVLTGSVVLLADLIRLLEMPLRVGLVQAKSYRGASTVRSELQIKADALPDLTDREVILIDDIFDTGHTLDRLLESFGTFGTKSIRSAVLLRKHGRQEVKREPDFYAFEIPDEFVVGYGLDYDDEYRNLPHIAALEPHEIVGNKS